MLCELCGIYEIIGLGIDGKNLCKDCLIKTEVDSIRNYMYSESIARQCFKVEELKQRPKPWWKRR